MTADDEQKRVRDQAALEHAWQWFPLHARQRMQCVNFFLVAVAFLAAAFVTALKDKHYAVAMGVGLLGAWLSWWFHRLDLRTKELVEAGQAVLRHSQRRLATQTGIEELEILKRVERPVRCWTSYSDVIRVLHWTTLVAFLGGAAYAAGVRLCLVTLGG